MVVVRATPPRPVDSIRSCICHLESTRAIVSSKPHKPSSLHHVFPRPRRRPPSASRSYVVVAEITAVFYFDQHPRRSIRLSSPTKPKNIRLQPCSTLGRDHPAHLRAFLDALCLHDLVTMRSRLLRALYAHHRPSTPYTFQALSANSMHQKKSPCKSDPIIHMHNFSFLVSICL